MPHWARGDKVSAFINARAETAADKPAFRDAFRKRRCLVPADGFFEWRRGTLPKQPYHVHFASGRPFAFAGLWEQWRPNCRAE